MRPAADGTTHLTRPRMRLEPAKPGLTFHSTRHGHKTWMIADGWVSRLFAVTALLFGVLASALTLATRCWVFVWAGAFGGWFASVDGVLAIWSRQSSGGDLGIGVVIAVVAVIVLAADWLRTAWWRD